MTTTTTTMTTMTPREAINQTGQSSGNDTSDLAIGILRTDKGLYMSRLPLGFTDDDGREGEGGGGGEYDGECLFHDASYDDEYDDDNKYGNEDVYNDAEDGKGLRGGAVDGGNLTMTVETLSVGTPLVAWGIGCRSLAPTPPPPSLTTTTTTTITAAVGGCRAPPPSGPSRPAGRRSSLYRPAGCRSSLSMLPTAADGGGTRAFEAWSYAWSRRKVRAVVLIHVLIQPGVDDGGKRSGVMLAGLCGRHRQAGEGRGGGAARAAATTTRATGEGG
jgi:hypothetical protein